MWGRDCLLTNGIYLFNRSVNRTIKYIKTGTDLSAVFFLPCIQLAHEKFELTNQDLAGGKNLTTLTSMKVNGKDIK